jgi:hypothetical protein
MPSVYSCETPKAKKEHQCCECGGIISIGEHYNYHHGIWEGAAMTYKVCVDCDDLRRQVDSECRYDEVTGFGYLLESVIDYGDAEWKSTFEEIKKRRKAKR